MRTLARKVLQSHTTIRPRCPRQTIQLTQNRIGTISIRNLQRNAYFCYGNSWPQYALNVASNGAPNGTSNIAANIAPYTSQRQGSQEEQSGEEEEPTKGRPSGHHDSGRTGVIGWSPGEGGPKWAAHWCHIMSWTITWVALEQQLR